MNKKNLKIKQYSIVAVLVVISIVLVGLIYSVGQKSKENQQVIGAENITSDPIVDEINYSDVDVKDSTQDNEVENLVVDVEGIVTENQNEQEESTEVNVESIDIDEDSSTEISVIEVEEIDEPTSEEPEKPDMTPPEEIPETTDDLTDPDKVPEYDEEETTYTPEPEPEEVEDEVRGSNLVPDSENPFLQDDIPSNGDMGEMMGEDYDEGAPSGEGDKF